VSTLPAAEAADATLAGRTRTVHQRQATGPGHRSAGRVLLASPRGFCAGVARAVDTAERALEMYGPSVYVRKQIVHNSHVVSELQRRDAVFVDETDYVPEGAVVVFSAHGMAPSVVRSDLTPSAIRTRTKEESHYIPARKGR
jgi:4-hydroxy-3-methylbut-2-enyl diphosphate reductase